MTIGEHIKERQPYMLAAIMRIYCLDMWADPPEVVQKMHKVEQEPSLFYKRMMRHDSFERRNGALKQRGWG